MFAASAIGSVSFLTNFKIFDPDDPSTMFMNVEIPALNASLVSSFEVILTEGDSPYSCVGHRMESFSDEVFAHLGVRPSCRTSRYARSLQCHVEGQLDTLGSCRVAVGRQQIPQQLTVSVAGMSVATIPSFILERMALIGKNVLEGLDPMDAVFVRAYLKTAMMSLRPTPSVQEKYTRKWATWVSSADLHYGSAFYLPVLSAAWRAMGYEPYILLAGEHWSAAMGRSRTSAGPLSLVLRTLDEASVRYHLLRPLDDPTATLHTIELLPEQPRCKTPAGTDCSYVGFAGHTGAICAHPSRR